MRLLRSIYTKGQRAAARGRKLSQVDLRGWERAEKLLHGELAVSLDIPPDEVADYIKDHLAAHGPA